ncbi:hypothetical protein O3P69_020648 [Scylla paramamosain]|uniref:FAM86 N-terminal domain-containing protein n=1 Tax=Scylla paramamosain TaxID=85552 RepID=A0AAW0TR32_SCYPA
MLLPRQDKATPVSLTPIISCMDGGGGKLWSLADFAEAGSCTILTSKYEETISVCLHCGTEGSRPEIFAHGSSLDVIQECKQTARVAGSGYEAVKWNSDTKRMCSTLEIEDLSWKYLCMYPLRDFMWENFQKILTTMDYDESQVFQQQVLQGTANHPVAQKYPPAKTYMQLFLKTLINQIEDCNQEVLDDLYSMYTGLLSQGNFQTSDFCYKTYKQKSGSITLKETCKLICDGTTGMCTWEASHFLAEWCSKNTSHFQGKKILELGAGLGLTGLAVMKNCKPASYTFTDVHDSVLKVLVENIVINLFSEVSQSSGEYDADNMKSIESWSRNFESKDHDTVVHIKKLDWESDTYESDVDLVLAADVVYDPDVIVHFIKVLKDVLCKKPGVAAYVASTVRNPDTYVFFRNELARSGLVVTSEVQQQYRDSPSQQEVSLSLLYIKPEV